MNTTSGELSRTVDAHQVQDLALNQRNYAQLVSLIPGAALTTFDQTTLTTGMSTTAASVNGNRADGNLFTVDGGFNLDGGSNATQLNNVGLDFVREVAVKTSNYSAEYGRSDGASINVVTRSGGNSFHGGLFDYVRNDRFDAINVASKLNATPTSPAVKPSLRFNDFGWNVGGPIVHDKFFFFAGEEWKRIRQSATPQNMTVPTSAELTGDFRDVAGLTLHAPPNAPAGCTITNNVLSSQCITTDGKAIAAVYALMSKQASTFNNTPTANNATFQPNNPQNWREDIVRLDYQIGPKHSLYGRYIHDNLNLIDAFGTFTPGGLPTTPTNRIRPGYSYQVGEVWTVSPRLINEAKLNVAWNKQRIPPSGTAWQRGTYGFIFTPPLGLVGTYPDGIPHVTFTGIGSAFPTAAPAQFTGPYFSLIAPTTDISPSDNVTWQVRSHTLKSGAMFARNRKDQNSRPNSYNGAINFSTNGNPNTTGDPFADALMGNFQTLTQQSADPLGHFRFNDFEAYIDDSWKVNQKLSLELGVRYLRTGPTYTQANNMVNFDPGLYNPTQAPTVGPNNIPTGGLLDNGFVINGLVRPGAVPAGQLGRVPGGDSPFVTAVPASAPRGFYKPENLFGLRLSFAFSPFRDDKTAIRGGLGLFFDKPEGNIIFGQPGVVPFLKAVTYSNANLSNPSGGAGVTPTIFGLSAVDPNFVVARVLQYSVSVQRELRHGILLEVAYVGNQGRHLVRQPNINVPTFATAAASVGKTTNQGRPYLGYTDITQFRSDADSKYNALQIYATKRKGNLIATISYTYSKAQGDASGINDNPEPECPFTCQLADGRIVSWQQAHHGDTEETEAAQRENIHLVRRVSQRVARQDRKTRALLLLLSLFVAIPCVRAQQTGVIANTAGRKTISLNGQWQTIIDPYETGYYDYRYQPSANGYFKDAKPKSKSDLIEYDFDTSESLTVPGDWNTQRERLLLYEGTIWYKKSFDYQRKPNTRLFVYFGGANYLADVYLNGEKIGRHEGGFTPFNFEVTNLVRDKSNSLVVKVDNKRRRDAVPTLNTDWWNYGGLTREVKLVETPATFVQDYFIQLRKGSRDQISGWVRLNGDRLTQKVTVRIPEARVSRSVTTDANGNAEISFSANLTLWSPNNPKLYDVVIEAETDQVQDRIGFRTIEVKGPEILLNGRPIFLRGVSIHEEAPFRGGRAYSREDASTLLGWAKELGCNFVRLAHYPHNEFMVREADRLGIMVWSEIPVYWTILWENPPTFDNAQTQLSEMIARDKNRAAVIIWSMANETPIGDARLAFLKKLIERAKSLDSTRLISAALERHYLDEQTEMIDDPLGEYLDVLGCNEYVGWYDGLPEKADRLEWKTKYQKPLIMSEFGGDALYGNHGDALTRWTEEYQENLYQHQVSMLRRISFLRGTCPWILMDFRSPRRPLPGIQDFHNRKGLISDRGERKKAFYVMQKYYRELEARSQN